MKIGVDLDGVIFDYVSAAGEVFFPDGDWPIPRKWEIWEEWGMSRGDFQRTIDDAYEDHLFLRGKAYPWAISFLDELAEDGHTIHIITARDHSVARLDTIRWLSKHLIPYDSLTFHQDKTAFPVDFYVDDNPENVVACLNAGVKAYVYDQPWNRKQGEGLPRLGTLWGFKKLIDRATALQADEDEAPEATVASDEVRLFPTGAIRDSDANKLDYEGFLSPAALRRYAEYMHKNRKLPDGSLRSSDNWQSGIPRDAYMKSAWRHFVDVWTAHRGGSGCPPIDESLCALLFNVQGYLHEVMRDGPDPTA